jgi:hypothetical protein
MLETRRMQAVRHLLEIGGYAADALCEQLHLRLERRPGNMLLDALQFDSQHGQLLADAVVKLTRDSRSLRFLRIEQTTVERYGL